MTLRTDVLLWVAESPEGRTWTEAFDKFAPANEPAWRLLDVWEDLLGTGAVRYTDSGGTRIEVTR